MLFSRSKLILASISGILLGVSFPQIGLWWCAWFALVPLFSAIRGLSDKDAFWVGAISGGVSSLIAVNWLFFVLKTYADIPSWQCFFYFVLFVFYLALYPAVFSVMISRLIKGPYDLLLVAPAGWVVLDFLRGILLTGFPWEFIGYSQFEQLYIAQISDVFGVHGISFLLIIFNTAIYILILFLFGKKLGQHIVNIKIVFVCCFSVLMMLTLTVCYGYWRISDVEQRMVGAERLKIGLVQGNIDQSLKWDPAFQITTIKKYIELSKLLSLDNPDLVVWPETATPFYFGDSPGLTDLVIEAVKDIRTDFVIGSPTRSSDSGGGTGPHYNSAYLLDSCGEIRGRYDKVHLVPFGEYSPLRSLTSFCGKFVFSSGDFKSGVPGYVLPWRSECDRLGVQICYEIIFSTLSRLMTINGAGLLINITNDAWFGYSAATYQHFSMSVFRAIENRRSLVRAANTGISGFVDPTGKILAKTSIFRDEVLIENIPVLHFKTLYTSLGDSFVLICSGIVIYAFSNFVFRSES